MKLRYALLALFFAPTLASAQTSAQAQYSELIITSPASIAATISNFDYSAFPTPPYAFPDTANADPGNIGGIIGTSVFQYPRAVQGDTLPRGVVSTPTGVTAELALALTAGGDLALGCVSATDSTSDIGNAAELAGKIVMIRRGTCAFWTKARSVEDAGAVAFLVFNPETEARNWAINMGGGTQPSNRQILIPGAFLPWPVAQPIFNELANGTTVTGTLRLDRVYVAGEGRPSPTGAGLFLAGENPTSTAARFVVRTQDAENVTVTAYNMLGQQVAVLYRGAVLGEQAVSLSAANLPAGSYFVRAVGESFNMTQQVSIVR